MKRRSQRPEQLDQSRGLKYVYKIKSMSFLHRAYQFSSCQHWRAIAVVSRAFREDQRAFPGLFSVLQRPEQPILSDGLKYLYKIKSVAFLHEFIVAVHTEY